jgi:hypothetical protein
LYRRIPLEFYEIMSDVEDSVIDDIRSFLRKKPSQQERSEVDAGRIQTWQTISDEDLDDPDLAYNFSYPKKGFCLIFNQHQFDPKTGQNARSGTNHDRDNIKGVFTQLEYEVHVFDDSSRNKIFDRLRYFSRHADLRQMSSFVFVMLSHGYGNRIFSRDGEIIIDELVSFFKGDKCPALIGKPKLFFIQACRGDDFDRGTHTLVTESTREVRKLPIEADILIAYSTVPGYFSWRNNQNGSWFIQKLCLALQCYGKEMDLASIMILTNRLVAFEYSSCTDSKLTNDMKQIPSVVSQLCKKVYFYPRQRGVPGGDG